MSSLKWIKLRIVPERDVELLLAIGQELFLATLVGFDTEGDPEFQCDLWSSPFTVDRDVAHWAYFNLPPS